MSFVSYAQNFEDVMLWRALRDIPNGFYVDVGAWSPEVDSVTLAFYERGWSGINMPSVHGMTARFWKICSSANSDRLYGVDRLFE